MNTIRVGIVGVGANTRLRHVPGLRACDDVEIVSVCNRRPESTRQAADEYGIPRTFNKWQDLVADENIDAVVIGTWPYLHCEVTVAALRAGKHVLVEARMARNAAEAHLMLDASRQRDSLVAQIVPSPFGLRVHQTVKELLDDGYVGQLREVVVLGCHAGHADPATPLHWRQSAELSGLNMLAMGILHETLIRWVPDPVRVLAQTQTFTPQRPSPDTGEPGDVGTPDSVHILTELPGGARGIYHLSGVTHHAPPMQIRLFGSEGTLLYLCDPDDRLLGARKGEGELAEILIPAEKQGGWRVEADFINAIRGDKSVQFTDFATGVRYMEFTDAVARSAAGGRAIALPLEG
ncbi:MAG: Gfo/Idh/MocA family oxidoreductase [Fuerstiella sp.]|nr:Gfo/Idh/MocA family oxidoreductase [Fuerstiella sp.]MCP4854292.1 Gfo/Idh/MocA family oxidoreductase [Fuerstiella sp.]